MPLLKKGSKIGIVSQSWGGPCAFPEAFSLGVERLVQIFGLQLKDYSTTRETQSFLGSNPEKRAEDLMLAFEDEDTDMIISSIGGDDSIRILPFLDVERIKKSSKPLMGFSDTTTLLTFLNQQGIITLHGPSVMAGFAEPVELHSEFISHVQKFLFESWDTFYYQKYSTWTESKMDWSDPKSYTIPKLYHENTGWQILQGNGVFSGELYGGNLEIFEMIKGTPFMEDVEFLQGKILFLETSEEEPSVSYVKYALRSMGVRGVFNHVSGIIFGRAKGYSDQKKEKLYKIMKKVIAEEFGKIELPIVADMDFGHTSPQWILPLGIKATINLQDQSFMLNEPIV